MVTYRACTENDVDAVLRLWRTSGAVAGSTDTRASLLTRLERDQELFVLAHAQDLPGSGRIWPNMNKIHDLQSPVFARLW